MKYFIISDTHFGHPLLINIGDRKLGFEENIFKQLKQLPEDCILIHLGDICIGLDSFWHERLSSFKFKKILVKGNHDRKSYSWYLEHGWDWVCENMVMRIGGKYVVLSHIPVDEQLQGDMINIHGHYHTRFHKERLKEVNKWCYSCEIENYKPKDIMKIIEEFN